MRACSLYAGRTSVIVGLDRLCASSCGAGERAADTAEPGAGAEDIRRMVIGTLRIEPPAGGEKGERPGPQGRDAECGAQWNGPAPVRPRAPDHDERGDRQP